MAILDILVYPDPRLRTVAKPVEKVDERIQTLVKDMIETMHDAQGIGLAATQVNVHGLLAICIQHEMDHLQGKVFVDYLSKLKQDRVRKKLIKRTRT